MSDDDLAQHLQRLGLTTAEGEVYLALLATGHTTAIQASEKLGREPDEVERALDRLIELGLAAKSGADASSVVPAEPSIALDHLTNSRSAELQQAHIATINAYRGFRRSVQPQATDDLVEVLTGPQITERVGQIEGATETEVVRFDSPPYHMNRPTNPTELHNLERGITYRVVYARSSVQNSNYYESNIRPCIAAGEQARLLPTVPVKLTIFDGRLAMVSMSFVEAEINDSLLVVRASSLLSALTGLFETSWRSAFPLHLGGKVPPALSPVQARILELLGAGLTDDSMAMLLGISRRTLSRNLEQLNHRAGATTRFQLALYAARKGWL
ncbi:helix-turn-helix domain-containing protein [Streptomyces sp. NPDC058989]|uniref:helix-turn-helix domain-containing protein n=1 Tax=Streptomyces sp. NPDC058989 TaxID=3346686 RepID=UPI0036783CD7